MEEDFSKYNAEGTVLRKAQTRMLEILVEVDKICRKHNIPYWLEAGTLLGAVRHGGFIPWDDDIDITVLMKDYKRLRLILMEELPEHLAFQDWKTEKNLVMKMGKVRDKKSRIEDSLYVGKLEHEGLYIDIFPMEKHISLRARGVIDFFYGRAFRRLRGFSTSSKEKLIAQLMWPFCLALVGIYKCISIFFKTKYISHPFGGISFNYMHQLTNVFPQSTIFFEGKEFLAPGNIHEYLTVPYNDYMKIPPVEKRQIHASRIEFYD